MRPENRLKHLKRADRWTVNEVRIPDGVVAAPRRPRRAVVGPFVLGAVTVLIAALVVYGAVTISHVRGTQPLPPATPVPTETASPTPTPTSVPSETPTVTATNPASTSPAAAPAQPLGGDCSALATTKQLSTAAGKTVTLTPDGTSDVAQGPGYLSTTVDATWKFATRQSGGLSCYWSTNSSQHTLTASVTILPVGTPHLPTANKLCTKSATMLGDGGYPDCEIVRIVNGTVLMGYVYSDSHAASLAFSKKFVALFDASARAHSPAPAVVASNGVWPLMVDCAAIKPDAVDGATWTLKQAQIGYDGGAGNIVSRISGNKKDTLYCAAVTHDLPAGVPKNLQYTVYGGGAWMLDEYTAAGLTEAVDVPGFDHSALVTTSDTGLQFLVMTRGSNLLATSAYEFTRRSLPVSTAYPLATAIADALDRLEK